MDNVGRTRFLTYMLGAVLFFAAYGNSSGVCQTIPQSKEQVSLSFSPVVKKVAPAVVNVYTKRTVAQRYVNPFMNDPFFAPFFRGNSMGGRMRKQVESSLGSGVIVDEEGLIVTNAHVIKGADEITAVLSDGREFDASLALVDEASDIALLKIEDKVEDLPYAVLRSSETLEVGDLVLAIGNPFGVGQTVTSGIVSAQGTSSLDINDFNFFIQTDAAINPGNSGGPLVALDGSVVGINTAIYSRDGGSLGIGFAVPADIVVSIITAEKAGQAGENGIIRPWLGVTAQTVTSDIANSLNLARPSGALISALHSESPLKKAGMKVGDVVLTINDKVIRDPAEMKFRMATVPMGEKAEFTVFRNGKNSAFRVIAMPPPDKPDRKTIKLKGENALSGAIVANINPAVALEAGIAIESRDGVVVLDVEDRSVASRLVQKGDILLQINGKDISATSDVEKALKSGARAFSMVYERRGQTRQIVIR